MVYAYYVLNGQESEGEIMKNFKKITAAALAAAMLGAAVPVAGMLSEPLGVTANAAGTLTEGDYSYAVNKDGETVTITKYNGTNATVVIPGTLGGKAVTAIGVNAFFRRESLTSVTISDGVTKIGDLAFEGCASLESISIAENNPSYSSVGGVLFNKDKSKLIYYPVGIKNISYTIPDSVTTIGSGAFSHCTSLESVTIPDGVIMIGDYAFEGCTSLTGVTIPGGVTTIESWTFRGCTSLESISVAENNQSYSSVDGVLFSKDKSELVCYPVGKNDESYTIPDGVTTIGYPAFSNCTSLSSVTIPDSVATIGNYAFEGCTSLATVNYGGTKAEWGTIKINAEYNECLLNADIVCTPAASDTSEPTSSDISEPITSDTSEPATSDTSDPTTSDPATSTSTTSNPTTSSTVTSNPATSDSAPNAPDSSDKQETISATLKSVDSKNGLSGEQLEKQLFGDSGWTWQQVEKIEFASDKLFSVQYTAADGRNKTLGEQTDAGAADGGIWNTEWTLDISLMSKNKPFVKLIAKDGTADITAKLYIKKDAEKPSNSDQKSTGIALATAPAVLAASAVVAVSKKRK